MLWRRKSIKLSWGLLTGPLTIARLQVHVSGLGVQTRPMIHLLCSLFQTLFCLRTSTLSRSKGEKNHLSFVHSFVQSFAVV